MHVSSLRLPVHNMQMRECIYRRSPTHHRGSVIVERRWRIAAIIPWSWIATQPHRGILKVYDAAANYNLKRLATAEKSARRAIGLDTRHEIPRAEVLLESVLAAEGDRRGAVEHLRKYLEISPKAPDAAEVSRTIAKLESTEGEGK